MRELREAERPSVKTSHPCTADLSSPSEFLAQESLYASSTQRVRLFRRPPGRRNRRWTPARYAERRIPLRVQSTWSSRHVDGLTRRTGNDDVRVVALELNSAEVEYHPSHVGARYVAAEMQRQSATQARETFFHANEGGCRRMYGGVSKMRLRLWMWPRRSNSI